VTPVDLNGVFYAEFKEILCE